MCYNLLQIITGLVLILAIHTNVFADELTIFCGAAFKKSIDEVISLYEKKTNTKIYASYGATKTILPQVMFTKQGDIFIAPSPDMMAMAIEKDIVKKNSISNFTYMIPVILIKKGNPKSIKSLQDILRDDVKFAIANPENVYIGMLAAEILEKNFSNAELNILRKKISTYADDISKLTTYLIMNQVDAILGFDCLKGWEPDKIDIVKLKREEIIRISSGQIGILTYAKDTEKANQFINFLLSPEGQEIFKKYAYIMTEEDAFAFAGNQIMIGGNPEITKEWLQK